MTGARRKPARGKSAGKGRGPGKRATAKRRARARVRAARPKLKPKRTPKARSRARRTARPTAAQGAKPARRTPRKTRPLKAVVAKARRGARAASPPAFPQTTGASARQQLLFRMVKARASVLAAVQGMSAATAERPLAVGKWNSRETILHLVTRDRARLREMEAALRGIRPSWDGTDPAGQARANEEDLAPLRAIAWEDAVRLLLTTRQKLMEAVESIPDEPAEVWGEAHPLGWMFQRLPTHDLHHADIIKRSRSEHGA